MHFTTFITSSWRRLAVVACAVCLLLSATGCQKKVEKTQDPAEVEQMRLEHQRTMQREMEGSPYANKQR
ncbi:MAG: hypothetical protein R3E01_30630 [Pirellulaceae bacterium]|nr:hypothetical protein [Planctomycetales bacterium]